MTGRISVFFPADSKTDIKSDDSSSPKTVRKRLEAGRQAPDRIFVRYLSFGTYLPRTNTRRSSRGGPGRNQVESETKGWRINEGPFAQALFPG